MFINKQINVCLEAIYEEVVHCHLYTISPYVTFGSMYARAFSSMLRIQVFNWPTKKIVTVLYRYCVLRKSRGAEILGHH